MVYPLCQQGVVRRRHRTVVGAGTKFKIGRIYYFLKHDKTQRESQSRRGCRSSVNIKEGRSDGSYESMWLPSFERKVVASSGDGACSRPGRGIPILTGGIAMVVMSPDEGGDGDLDRIGEGGAVFLGEEVITTYEESFRKRGKIHESGSRFQQANSLASWSIRLLYG